VSRRLAAQGEWGQGAGPGCRSSLDRSQGLGGGRQPGGTSPQHTSPDGARCKPYTLLAGFPPTPKHSRVLHATASTVACSPEELGASAKDTFFVGADEALDNVRTLNKNTKVMKSFSVVSPLMSMP